MKDEKKVTKAEEVKKEVQTEEEGAKLTDEQLSRVSGGNVSYNNDVLNTFTVALR